jgi:parallel beta-helix repeat protein
MSNALGRLSIVAIGLVAAFSAAAGAATYYVSPSGDDANPCTSPLPCREIRQPLTFVAAGDTILVADGSYKGFDVFDVHGGPGAPITIQAQGTGAVVLVTNDRPDNRDTIFITFSSDVVVDGLRAFNAIRAAVRVDQSPRITVRNGVFGNNMTWGIFTDFSDDLLLEGNECYGSIEEHGIYVSNSGDRPVVRANRVHDNNASGIQLNADLSAGGDGIITGALIENNVAWGNGVLGGAAINLDGVQDSVVRNNLLYDNHATGIVNYMGDGAEGPRGMSILHNTVDQAVDGRWALLMWNTTGPNLVRNNILHNRNPSRGGITYLDPIDVTNTDSDYNIMDLVTPDDGNTVYTLAEWQALGHEPHSLSAPLASLFVDPDAGDYHLSPTSPAVDAGQTLPQVPVDIEGNLRPQGAASDVGAYERTPPVTPVISISDCSVAEGNTGQAPCTFTVSLSAPSNVDVSVSYATANGTASAGSDYSPAAGTLFFTPGTTGQPLSVQVLGDAAVETDETFLVNLSGPTNATLGDAQGVGTIGDDDAPSLSSNELGHGTVQHADLLVRPDLYRIGQKPYSSYEVVIDGTSGDIVPVTLQRLAGDNLTVIQAASPVAVGDAVSLRWENATALTVTNQHIRVNGMCSTPCGSDDVYRARAFETTYSIPRFNNAGSQITVLVMQNPATYPISGHVWFWSPSSGLLGSQAFNLAARQTFVLNTAAVPGVAGHAGAITVSHDGRYGDLTGKTVALEPSTGFSFDSPMTSRPR